MLSFSAYFLDFLVAFFLVAGFFLGAAFFFVAGFFLVAAFFLGAYIDMIINTQGRYGE